MSEEMKDELNLQEPQAEVKEEVIEQPQEEQVESVETKQDEIETKEETPSEQPPCAKCGKVECECEKEEAESKEEEKTEEVESEEKEDIKEDLTEEKEEQEEEKAEPERDQVREDLIAELEELKAEKEEREALEACNKEVMKVEQEFTTCSERIAQALKDSFAQNGIDSSKSLEELKKEDPAKATLAMQFISQAQELKAQLENAAMKEITKHQNDVIYKAASREFEKMSLNMEQAKEAVATFKRIVNEVGISDLKEDLQMKVQLAAGRAKMLHPLVESVQNESKIMDTTTLEEPSPEKEPVVEVEKEEIKEEVPPTPVVEKPKAEDFEEGVAGNSSANAGTLINELNVLEELAKLPYKERARFYKEHEDVITKALSKRG